MEPRNKREIVIGSDKLSHLDCILKYMLYQNAPVSTSKGKIYEYVKCLAHALFTH